MDSIKNRTSIDGAPKQKTFSSTKQLQFHVANIYSEIAQMIQERDDLEIEMPQQVPTAIERVNLVKSVLTYVLEQCRVGPRQNKQMKNQVNNQDNNENSTIFQCKDCENYEKNLQKLESEVRNHIRTHQQLKLYQDGLEEKIQQYKKEKKDIQKKYDSIKKKYQEMKNNVSMHTQRMTKYESQNQKLKSELKNYRSGAKYAHEDNHHPKRLNRYESNKQNLNDWRNQQKNQRNSVQRRHQSTERMRVSVNVKSSKGIPLSSKIIQDKRHREQTHKDKQKQIKNRIGFAY